MIFRPLWTCHIGNCEVDVGVECQKFISLTYFSSEYLWNSFRFISFQSFYSGTKLRVKKYMDESQLKTIRGILQVFNKNSGDGVLESEKNSEGSSMCFVPSLSSLYLNFITNFRQGIFSNEGSFLCLVAFFLQNISMFKKYLLSPHLQFRQCLGKASIQGLILKSI